MTEQSGIMWSMKTQTIKSKETKDSNLLAHFEKMVELSEKKGFTDRFWEKAKPHISFVAKKLKMTDMQAVIFSNILTFGDNSFSLEEISESLHCTKIWIIRHLCDFEELEKRKLIRCKREEYEDAKYYIPFDVIDAIRNGNDYEPPTQKNIPIMELFKFMNSLFTQREKLKLHIKLPKDAIVISC
jgi:hypothetical protein